VGSREANVSDDARDDDPEAREPEASRTAEPTTPEGVRILGAEEAQAAMEGGQVGRRLGEDDLRPGDVPPRPDPGLRPAVRFPLPADRTTPTPRVAPARGSDEPLEPTIEPLDGDDDRGEGAEDPGNAQAPGGAAESWPGAVWAEDDLTLGGENGADAPAPSADRGAEPVDGDGRSGTPVEPRAEEGGDRFGDRWREREDEWREQQWRREEPVEELVLDEEGEAPGSVERVPTEASGSMPLPHWTEPPTGDVPQLLPEAEPVDITGDEDADAWASLAGSAPRFRTDAQDWAESDFDFGASLRDDAPGLGALADEVDDDVVFEEQVARRRRPVARAARGERPRRAEPARRPRPEEPAAPGRASGGSDMPTRIVTGIAVAVVALICLKFGRGTATAMVAVIVGLATLELYEAFRRAGHRPASVLGLLGSITLVVAAYKRGVRAYPDIFVLVLIFSMLWYLTGVVRARANVNIGMTLLGFGYVGGLGAFAGLLLTQPDGVGLVLGMAICAVGYDLFGYFVGSQFGRTRIAPGISPNKTLEGLLAGMSAAVVLGVIVSGVIKLTPWDAKVSYGLALGVVVAIMAPLGDLCESMIKRDLGVKDLGSILPGHGGVLDRFDAMLFCLPAVYYLARYLGIG
jgi:phosphatidate cytidylyltransferase